jgi:hypothetical protein
MYQISKVCVGNYGHKDARFKSEVVDLVSAKNGRVAKSALLYAPNGKGKTTFLSFMLHLFKPHRKDFVQSRQKPHHKVHDYFRETEPGFIIMELTKQTDGDSFLQTDKPALIIGAVITRKANDLTHRFFMIDPTGGYTLDMIDFVKPILDGIRTDVTHTMVNEWLSSVQSGRYAADFRQYGNFKQWETALTGMGFNIKGFETMITMASQEGGIEKFLTAKNADELLVNVFSLIIDEAVYRGTAEELSNFIADTEQLPREKRFFESTTALADLEEKLASAASDLEGHRVRLDAARAKAAGAYSAILSEIQEHQDELDDVASAIRSQDSDLKTAKEQLLDRSLEREAIRVDLAKLSLAACDAELNECRGSIARATDDLKIVNSLGPFRKLRGAESLRANHVEALEALKQTAKDFQAPVNAAGDVYRKALSAAIKGADSAIAGLTQGIITTKTERSDAQSERARIDGDITAKEREIAAAEVAAAEMTNVLVDIDEVAGSSVRTYADAVRLREELSGRKTTETRILLEAETQARDLAKSLEVIAQDGLRIEKESEEAARSLSHARTVSAAYGEAVGAIVLGHLEYLIPGETADIESEALVASLKQRRSEHVASIDQSKHKRGALEEQRAYVDEVGMFEDADMRRALEQCANLGIKDVSPYANWIAKSYSDAETARAFAEGNLHVTLGLKVNNQADLDKIEASFDRKKWKLRKPVAVSVIGKTADTAIKANDGLYILSAETDYAYHDQSREDRKREIDAELVSVAETLAYHENLRTRLENCLDAITSLKVRFPGKTAYEFLQAVASLENSLGVLEGKKLENIALTHATQANRMEAIDAVDAAKADVDSIMSTYSRVTALVDKLGPIAGRLGAIGDLATARLWISDQRAIGRILAEKIEVLEQRIDRDGEVRSRLLAERDGYDASRSLVSYFDGAREDDVMSVDLQNAKLDYERQKALFERNPKLGERATALESMIASSDREIADHTETIITVSDGSFADVGFAAVLASRAALSEPEIDAAKKKSKAEIENLNGVLEGLTERRGALSHEAKVSEQFKIHRADIERRLRSEDTQDVLVSRREESQNAIDEATARIAGTERSLEQSRARKDEIAAIRTRMQDIASGDLKFNAGNYKGAAPSPLIPEDGDWAAFIKSIISDVASASSTFKAANQRALDAYSSVNRFVGDTDNQFGDPAIRDQILSYASHEDHGPVAGRIAERLRHIADAHHAEINRRMKAQDDVVLSVSHLAQNAIDKVLEATKIVVEAKSSFAYGQPILKLPAGVDRTALRDLTVRDFAKAYVEQKIGGSAVIGSASQMSVEILKLVARHFGKESFSLRILKPVDQAVDHVWEDIHELTGSGGQTITAALLLYFVATALNSSGANANASQAFVILDNPVGKANKKSLVRLQLTMAEHFGIQMIATSGINDMYISCYEWIVSFDVKARAGSTLETRVHYNDNEVGMLKHRLKSPVTDTEAVA